MEQKLKLRFENITIPRNLWDKLGSREALVYGILNELHKDCKKCDTILISSRELAFIGNISQSTVIRALEELVKLGYVYPLETIKKLIPIKFRPEKDSLNPVSIPYRLIKTNLTYSDLIVYVAIQDLCYENNNNLGWCWLDEKLISAKTGINTSTVTTTISNLQIIHMIQLVYNYDDLCRVYLTPNHEIFEVEF